MPRHVPAERGFPVVVELPVVWGEMDSYRHVNNVVYFRYFESARLEYFRRLDWFEYEQQTGIGPILAATQARFRRPLTYPDTISVGARVAAVEEDRFTMEHLLVSRRLRPSRPKGKGRSSPITTARGRRCRSRRNCGSGSRELEGRSPDR